VSPPPPKSLGGLQDGAGAGSAGAGAGLGAERRLGAAFRADFFLVFLVDRFAAAFVALRRLRAGAAFFLVDRFFAFFLFAMIDLPILYRFKIRAVSTPKLASDARCDTSHLTLGHPLFNRLPSKAASPGSFFPWADAPAAPADKAHL
jgi:hypothetical protein